MNRQEYESIYGGCMQFSEDWNGERHRYGYTNRPFAIAHQPKGFIIGALDNDFRDAAAGVRWGWIEYPFELDASEVRNFELVRL